jgi:hypothetical protein
MKKGPASVIAGRAKFLGTKTPADGHPLSITITWQTNASVVGILIKRRASAGRSRSRHPLGVLQQPSEFQRNISCHGHDSVEPKKPLPSAHGWNDSNAASIERQLCCK